MSLSLTSPAFLHHGAIPAQYTCDGKNISPPLSWQGVPEEARSLLLIVDDPDAPDPAAPRMTCIHWLLYNIPVSTSALGEALTAHDLPDGTLQGSNDWRQTGYHGPCPPIGQHRYFFKLYALDSVLPDLKKPDKAHLEAAAQGHILAEAELVGVYQH